MEILRGPATVIEEFCTGVLRLPLGIPGRHGAERRIISQETCIRLILICDGQITGFFLQKYGCVFSSETQFLRFSEVNLAERRLDR